MTAEMQCRHEGCTTKQEGVDMFNGENPEHGWTWWKATGLTTCPAHYTDGKARERRAERASDG